MRGNSPFLTLLLSVYPYILNVQGVPKKHGNSVTNSISSLLWISILIPNFNSHNIIMSARWTVKTDKFTLFVYCVYCNFLVLLSTLYNRMQSKHKQTKCEHWTWQTKLLQITAFSVGITILNQRIIKNYWDTLYYGF